MKKDENNNKKTLIISILVIVIIVFIIAGGTYSYWSWSTKTNERTNVEFTITNPGGNLSARIVSNSDDFSNLAPTNKCAGSYSLKKPIDIYYTNNSGQKAKLEANLKLDSITGGNSQTLSADNKSHIHWVINTKENDCTTGLYGSGTFNNIPSTNIIKTITIDDIASVSGEQHKQYYLHVYIDESYEHENVGNVNNDPMQGLKMKFSWSGNIEQK